MSQPQAGVLSASLQGGKAPNLDSAQRRGEDGGVKGRRVSSFIAHKAPGVESLVCSKKRSTPAGMLTQNLYHQYLIARLLPLINGLMLEFSPSN